MNLFGAGFGVFFVILYLALMVFGIYVMFLFVKFLKLSIIALEKYISDNKNPIEKL